MHALLRPLQASRLGPRPLPIPVLTARTLGGLRHRSGSTSPLARFVGGGAVGSSVRNLRLLGLLPVRSVATETEEKLEKPAPEGFEIVRSEEIGEYAAKATILKHKKTGAEVLSMEKDDDNKVFGIAFRTPVEDSKGIPHILEHSVLCGSRSYKAKSPFIELRKSSLHTFLNAMTYPDRTLYPVASQNTKDFYNLAEVYLDSVLHPRAKEDPLVMAQEGWHYELTDKDEPLNIKGVVYNEMKGVYSSPDSLHGRFTMKSLFPDINYSEDSGGDPEAIPDLTFEEFKQFHDRYYHPSNARVFFYGNDNVDDRFKLLRKYLDEFDNSPDSPKKSQIPTQPLKTKPYRRSQRVPVAKGQEAKKNVATLAWLVSENSLSDEEDLAWSLIDQLLTGNTAAKLRKAVTDSGLGSSVMGGGMSSYLKQPFYSIGLKGMESEEKAEEFEKLVLDVLTDAAENGFDKAAIDAAMNRVEFSLREFDTASTQRGMAFLMGAMSDWNYDRDPVSGFRFEKTLHLVKDKLETDPHYLQGFIKKRLLDNQHRLLATSVPDSTIEEQKEKKLEEKLSKEKDKMSGEQLEEIIELTNTLKERQAKPDSPDDIASIPRLGRQDLDTDVKRIHRTEKSVGDGIALMVHDQSTNGIAYVDYAINISNLLDLDALKDDDMALVLLPLFTRIASGATGSRSKDRVELRRAIDTHTGGVSCSWGLSTPIARGDKGACVVAEPDSAMIRLYMRGKSTANEAEKLLELFQEMLYESRLDDQERVVQMLKESKTGMESSLVGRGNSYAVGRLAARRHVPGLLGEMTGGLEYYWSVCKLLEEAEKDYPKLQQRLEAIRENILKASKEDVAINLTADKDTIEKVVPVIDTFAASLPHKEVKESKKDSNSLSELLQQRAEASDSNEGVVIPTQVNYVGFGGRMYEPGERVPGSTSVVINFLRTGYLWEKIRVMGGAYGAGFSLNARMGTFAFSSYRDPNVVNSIENYKKAAEFLINTDIPEQEVERAVIGSISDLDYPQTPSGKGWTSFSRYFTGYTDDDAQKWRDEVLNTTVEDFREFGRRLLRVLESTENQPSACVFGSSTDLNKAIEEGVSMRLVQAFETPKQKD